MVRPLGAPGGTQCTPQSLGPRVGRLSHEVMTGAWGVARAGGGALARVAGTLDLDWLALTGPSRARGVGLALRHGVLLAVGARYRRMRSSMLSAIERGRPAAVAFLNGEVVSRGHAHGIATPVNAAATRRVHAPRRGEAAPGTAFIGTFARSVVPGRARTAPTAR